jgi:hypothetical protein
VVVDDEMNSGLEPDNKAAKGRVAAHASGLTTPTPEEEGSKWLRLPYQVYPDCYIASQS